MAPGRLDRDLARRSGRILGRSDSTLNRGGVRIGSAEIYAGGRALAEVADSLVVGVELPDGGYWMPLFVVPTPNPTCCASGHAGDPRRAVPSARAR